MKNKIFIGFLSFLIGVLIGIAISDIPRIKYDLNRNGKIDVGDIISFFNYYNKN